MIKVLIVDDEQWNLDLIRAVGEWGKLGMEVAGEASDGIEAVRLLDTIKPQIVITDMKMPGVDGIGLLEVLHDRYPAIRSIVVSGYDDFAYTRHAIRYKAMEYLLKPVDEIELNDALSKCKAEIDITEEGSKTSVLDLDWSKSVVMLKKQLACHFNDMNASGIQKVFTQLVQEERLTTDDGVGLVVRLTEELYVLLQELTAQNGMNEDRRHNKVDERMSLRHGGTPQKTVTTICDAYLSTLDQLVQWRKFRNKLNIEKVKLYIDRNYEQPLSLESLSRLFFVSKSYLSKTFKKEYERNVIDYLIEVKMSKAKNMLLDEQLPIKAVAEMVGYEDISYFHRVFRKHFGVSPGEMRRNSEL